ncbi:MAG: alpha/beta hydrolase [Cyanothece sp. SIO1E1]|nr:alpha/beta hydrolase [Cyanothece sp. SIO1E1]
MATSTRKSLNVSGVEISYLEWHQAQEPLLVLHGMADHALVWSSLGDYLTHQYHVVAPDLRGHGESSKPNQGYTFAELIADLEALMAHLGWTSAHILGHSWSAKLTAIWARQNPQRFRSLILVDPAFINRMPSWSKVTFPFFYRVLPFLKMMGPFSSYEQAEQQARQLKQYRDWHPLQQQAFQQGIEQKSDGQWGSKFVVQARDQIFDDVMRIAGLSEPIKIPTLFLQPEQGLNRFDWQLKPYHTYLKNLKIRKIPSNHWAFLVEPETFNQTVAEFLQAQSRV